MDVIKIVFAHFTDNPPSELSKFLPLSKNISTRATKTTESLYNNLDISRYSTIRLQRCIKYQGVKIGNNVPTEIQNSSARLFKSKYKKYPLLNYS